MIDQRNDRGSWPRWRGRLQKASAFSAQEWLLLGEALATLVGVQIALRVVPFPRLLAWATQVRPSRTDAAWPRERIDRTAWLVEIACRMPGVLCLARSLTLAKVLARRGVATDLRIGVRTDVGRLEAHAWVECGGRPLLDGPGALRSFARFDTPLGDVFNV